MILETDVEKKFFLTYSLVLILLIFFTSNLSASWIASGPYHKNIRAVAVSPINSNIIFAGSFGIGIYKSANGGLTWVNDKSGLLNTYVRSILALSDSLVFCGTNDGIFKSTDGGNTWSLSLSTLNSVRSLALDPHTNSLYAATFGTFLFKSTDGGSSWIQHIVKDNVTNDSLPHERAVAVFGKDSLYVGGSITDIDTTGGALFKSTNGGLSWTQVQPGLSIRSSVISIAISPNSPDSSLIIGTAVKGVYKSTNGGINWTQINGGGTLNPLPDLNTEAVGFNSTFRYVATDSTGGFYYRALGDTTDGWFSGSGLPGPTAVVDNITINNLARNLVYAGTEGKGVYLSSDSGKTWIPRNSGMLDIDARSLALTSAGRLILGTGFGDKIWVSTDKGTAWQMTQNLSTFNSIFSVIPTSDSSILYAAAYAAGVYRSTDRGLNWILTDTTTLLNHFVRAIVVDQSNPNLVYAGTGNGVFKTTNAGVSWSAGSGIPFSTAIHSLAIHPTLSNIVYAGTDHSYLYKSTDGGANWSHIATAQGFAVADSFIRTMTIDLANPAIMYAGCDSGHIYKSTDAGNNWSLLANLGIPNSVREILIHPVLDSIMFAATFGSGIFISTDRGVSWTPFNSGLTDLEVEALISDKNEPLTLWAGSGSRGVFKTVYSPFCSAIAGDVNANGLVNLVDIIFLVNFVFKGGTEPNPTCRGDANGNSSVNLTDIIYLVNFVFKGGQAPLKSGVCCL